MSANPKSERYFSSLEAALSGLDTFLAEDNSPAYAHDLIAGVVSGYLDKLHSSLRSWENKTAFSSKFRVSQTESGFPAFQNVLDLQNDISQAQAILDSIKDEDTLREQMIDQILTKKQFPTDFQNEFAKGRYYKAVQAGNHFSPLVLPTTIRVSVNPKTNRPYYVVHWGYYDGVANLPIIYMAVIEDSDPKIANMLVTANGKMNKQVNIKLPIGGLLNPELAVRFDEFCDKNSSYSLTLSTIGTNLDQDFEFLHPKQLRRFVLGPFYHSAYTRHGAKVDDILANVKRPENAWLMTWTMQEIFSENEQPAKWGLWGGSPAREEFYINTDDLDCARMGCSNFKRNALVPHEAYQAIYASGEAEKIFDGYERHVISDGHVLRNM